MIGIVTISDTRSLDTDRSGPAIEGALAAVGYTEFVRRIVIDESETIQAALIDLSPECEAIFTTGGTGFSPRDVTPEATAAVIERRADSLSELLRLKGLEHTPMSYLSRGIAGIRGNTLIVNLPGSPAGAREGIETLAPLLPHILSQLRGDGCGHEC